MPGGGHPALSYPAPRPAGAGIVPAVPAGENTGPGAGSCAGSGSGTGAGTGAGTVPKVPVYQGSDI